MNKYCYRVIYSKTLQRLVVVSELAKAENQSSSSSRSRTKKSAVATSCIISLKTITLALFTALGFVWTPLSFAESLEIHSDKSAPAHQRPTVLKTANDIPQVNIQTPNAKGLSHNKYSQLDVAEKGAILNNARKNTQTQLAGWVQGNPNLARGEAKVILNEVNASKPSQLKGYIEVAGKKADVIIANPSGLNCESCGVVNAGRVQLTTGQVAVENGEVKSFTVKQGTIKVAERGLDTSTADYTDIIAKNVKLESGIWAKELKVTTGTNRVDRKNSSVVYIGDKSAVKGEQISNYSVDVSELGGMYAGKIYVVDSDNGLGVHNAGHLGASAGDVQIDSQGRIINTGFIGAASELKIEANSDINNKGVLYARNGAVTLKSRQENITQSGTITARSHKNSDVNLSAQEGKITQTGQTLTTGNIHYQSSDIEVSPQATLAAGLVFAGEQILAGEQHSAGATVTLVANKNAEIQGHINATGEVAISGKQTHLDNSKINSYELNAISSNSPLSADQSHITTAHNIILTTPQNLSAKESQFNAERLLLSAKGVDKQKGIWLQRSRDDLVLDFQDGFDNSEGQLSSFGRIIFTSSQLSNVSGTLIADSFNIITPDLINRQGKLIKRAIQPTTLTISGELNNTQGVIGYKTATLEVNNENPSSTPSDNIALSNNVTQDIAFENANYSASHTASVPNSDVSIISKTSEITVTKHLDNQLGELLLGLDVNLSGEGKLNNAQGAIRTKTLSWQSQEDIHNQSGEITVQDSLSLIGHNLDNQFAQLRSQGALLLDTHQINNHEGLLESQGDLTLNSHQHDIINTNTLEKGKITKGIISGGKLSLTSGNLDNTHGLFLAKDQLVISARNVNNDHGNIESHQELSLSVNSFSQVSGVLKANKALTLTSEMLIRSQDNSRVEADSITLTSKSHFDNLDSEVVTNKSININNKGIVNKNGVINATEGSVHINTSLGKLDNISGLISAAQQLNIKSGVLNNSGLLQGSKSVNLNTHKKQLSNRDTLSKENDRGIISHGKLTINSGDLDNNNGLIFSTEKQTINVNGVDNNKGVIVSHQMQHLLLEHQLQNQNGLILSNESQHIQADEIDNIQGIIRAGSSSQIISQRALNNNTGTIFSTRLLELSAVGGSNQHGKIVAKLGAIKLDSQGQLLDNHSGIIKSFDKVDVQAGHIKNVEGHIGSTNATVKIDTGEAEINNNKGQIDALKALEINSGLFNNQQGTLYSDTAIVLNTQHHDLINIQSQTETGIQSKGDIFLMSLNNLNNQRGLIRAEGALSINANNIDNKHSGFISGSNGLTITANNVDNQAGTISSQASTAVTLTGTFNNKATSKVGSLINVAGPLTLKANTILNENTKAESQDVAQGVVADQVILSAQQINNQQGGIYAKSAVNGTVNNTLNNRTGEILSAGDIALKGATLELNNQDGKMESLNKLALNINRLNGEGRIAAKGDAEIDIAQDYIVTRSFDIEGNLSLSAKNLENRTKLTTSSSGINISTGALTNTATGSIESSNTLIKAQNLNNRGLINGDKTLVKVKNTINNIGTGRIYGDHLAIQAASLNNLDEGNKSAVIAARERLDIGVNTLINTKESELISLGTLYIGGYLDENNHASGRASAVYNNNALIQSEGEMQINATTLENRHDYLKTELKITDQQNVTEYQGSGATEHYLEGTPGLEVYNDESDHLRVPDGRTYEGWHKYHYLQTTQKDIVLPSAYAPGRIFSGGTLTLNGETILNKDSQIIAANGIDLISGQLIQQETKGRKIITKAGCNPNSNSKECEALAPELRGYTTEVENKILQKGTSGEYGVHSYWRHHEKGRDSTGHRRSDYVPPQEISNGEDLGVYIYKEYTLPTFETTQAQPLSPAQEVNITARSIQKVGNTDANGSISALPSFNFINLDVSDVSVDHHALKATEITKNELKSEVKENTVVRTLSPNITLPRSSLFVVNPSVDKHILVETDPAFTQYRQWLSSDYMFDMLHIAPQNMHKRLGDGYYEQQLIRNQISQLTGRLYLSNYKSQEEQYKALMNNGVTFARKFNYTLGTALSADQIAKLTSDIVWLVNKTVTLPNGETQTVLVPQVYIMSQRGAVDGKGAIIAGAEANIQSKTINNSGTIAGRDLAIIKAKTVTNQFGRFSANSLFMNATQDIENIGGQIDAEQALYIHAGRDFISKTTTTTVTNTKGESTTLNKQASIMLTGGNGRNMVVTAGRDINLTATELKAVSDSALTLLQADRDVISETVRTSHRYNNITNADNYQKDADYTDLGSTIEAKGNLQIAAGRDANLKQTTLASDKTVFISAERDINFTTGETYRYSEGATKDSSSGLFSSKTYSSHTLNKEKIVQGTDITGGKVLLNAGRNIEGTAVAIDGVNGTIALARKGQVTFTVGTNTYHSLSEYKTTKSGLLSSGGIGFTIGSQSESQRFDEKGSVQSNARSIIGSSGGGQVIIAGKEKVATIGADIIAQSDKTIVFQAEKIEVEAGKDVIKGNDEYEFKRSGLTIALSSSVTDLAQAAARSVKRGQEVKNPRLAQLYHLKAAQETALAAKALPDTIDTIKNIISDAQMQSKGSSSPQIKLSIGYGGQKSQTRRNTTEVTHSGSVHQAGEVIYHATGQADDAIKILGSDIYANKVEYNTAGGVKLSAVQDSFEHHSKNSSVAGNVGVFVGMSGNSYGIGVEGSAQVGKGKENEHRITQRNSHIKANETVFNVGKNVEQSGSVINTAKISGEIGGDLIQTSLQDTTYYENNQKQASAQGSVAIYGSGSSASISAGLNDIEASSAQVVEQTGIYVGAGGIDLTVNGKLKTKGGVISSEAPTSKNRLSVSRIEAEHIENSSDIKVESINVGVSTEMSGNIGNAVAASLSALNNLAEEEHSSTKSAVGNNIKLEVRNGEIPSVLSREVENSNQQVKEFDKEAYQERAEMAQVIGEISHNTVALFLRPKLEDAEKVLNDDSTSEEEKAQAREVIKHYGEGSKTQLAISSATAFAQGLAMGNGGAAIVGALSPYANKGIGDIAKSNKWRDGGLEKVALHGGLGALSALVSGGDVLSGAVSGAGGELIGSGVAKLLEKSELDKGSKDSLQGALASGIGLSLGRAIGGDGNNALIGARIAENAERYNRQLHPDEMKRIRELSQGDKEKEQRLTIAACALVHCSAQLAEDNPVYEQAKNLEKLGSSEAYAEERALLKQQKVLKEMVVSLPPSDETMSVPHSLFTYGMSDKLFDKTSKTNETYGVSTRIGGALQATGGALISASSTASAITACAGSSGLACGGTAALGAIGASYGVDQANAGVNSLLTGKNYSTYGSQLLSQMTGISPETAEAVYSLPLMWNGGNVLRTGSNAISHSVAGLKNSEILTKGIEGTRSTLNSVSKWAAAHPNATEAIVGGTVSTGFDIYNGNVTPEGTAMNYVLARTMAGKSVGKQISIATSYQAVVSGNDPNKSPDDLVTDMLIKGGSVGASFGATKSFHQIGVGKVGQVFFSELIGNYIGNYNNPNSYIKENEGK